MGGARDDLEEYREKVFQELKARAQKLKEVDTAIASHRYLLDGSGPARGLRSGNTLHALAGASNRARIMRQLDRLERQRSEAVADLKRAETRLADVEQEIEELEAQGGESPTEDDGDT